MAEADGLQGSGGLITILDEQPSYKPRDAVTESIRAGCITGGFGILLASVQNTLARQNYGAAGVFTKFGGTIGLFAGFGGIYTFVSIASANLRQKNDPYNHALGGFCSGAVLGLATRRIPSAVGLGALAAVVFAAADYAGKGSFGDVPEPGENRYLTKAEIRTRFRRPLNETVNELGEGRGIYGPNYEERRKRRIKENYGIDVPEPYYRKSS